MARRVACTSVAAYINAIKSGLIDTLNKKVAEVLYNSKLPMYQEQVAIALGRGGVQISTVTSVFAKLLKQGVILEAAGLMRNSRTGEMVTAYKFNHNQLATPTSVAPSVGKYWAISKSSPANLIGPLNKGDREKAVAASSSPHDWHRMRVKAGRIVLE